RWRLRIDVAEDDELLVLVNAIRGNLPCLDLAEEAVRIVVLLHPRRLGEVAGTRQDDGGRRERDRLGPQDARPEPANTRPRTPCCLHLGWAEASLRTNDHRAWRFERSEPRFVIRR